MKKYKHTQGKWISNIIIILALLISATACSNETVDNGKVTIVTTTTMLEDMAKTIGGDYVNVEALMGPGIDPHLYKASAGDVSLMQNADLVVYSGLHLEGKMGEIFENLESTDKHIVMIAKNLPEEKIITDESTGAHDPHIWFDVALWEKASYNLLQGIIEVDPEHESEYVLNHQKYIKDLQDLDSYIHTQIATIPEESRVLITAHDAFKYFGKAYGMKVLGLQGISTSSEAGTGDVTALANYIVENQIKAIFVESSVPKKNIEALQEAVSAQGFDVEIGGELYSDSLGSTGSDAETYIGTVKANVDTIVGALR